MILVLALVAVWFLLRRTRLGLTLYASGSDRQAAYLSGVDVRRARVAAYLLAGLLACLAGVASAAITGGAQARYSVGAANTLNSVAAVVVGGIALTGGAGRRSAPRRPATRCRCCRRCSGCWASRPPTPRS